MPGTWLPTMPCPVRNLWWITSHCEVTFRRTLILSTRQEKTPVQSSGGLLSSSSLTAEGALIPRSKRFQTHLVLRIPSQGEKKKKKSPIPSICPHCSWIRLFSRTASESLLWTKPSANFLRIKQVVVPRCLRWGSLGVSDVGSAVRVFTRQITSLGKAKALRDLLEYKDMNQSEQTNTLPGTSHFSPQARWYCMTQNESHNHFEPQFPHLGSRDNVGLTRWLSEFN